MVDKRISFHPHFVLPLPPGLVVVGGILPDAALKAAWQMSARQSRFAARLFAGKDQPRELAPWGHPPRAVAVLLKNLRLSKNLSHLNFLSLLNRFAPWACHLFFAARRLLACHLFFAARKLLLQLPPSPSRVLCAERSSPFGNIIFLRLRGWI